VAVGALSALRGNMIATAAVDAVDADAGAETAMPMVETEGLDVQETPELVVQAKNLLRLVVDRMYPLQWLMTLRPCPLA